MTNLFLSINGVKIIFVYSLQIIIFITFIKLLFAKQDDTEDLQKIIGGLTVFIVAIFANSSPVYFLSLLIGGLIIASEEFIKFIFAVWRSSPTGVGKVVQLFTLATPEEIEKKNVEDIKFQSKFENGENVETLQKKYLNAENQIHDFFRKKYGHLYVQEIKIKNQYGSKIFDGAITSKAKALEIFSKDELRGRNDLRLQSAVEIKFFKDAKSVGVIIEKLIGHLCFFDFIIFYKIVIIIENLSKEDADKIFLDLTKTYSNRQQFEFYIFSYTNNKVELVRSQN